MSEFRLKVTLHQFNDETNRNKIQRQWDHYRLSFAQRLASELH